MQLPAGLASQVRLAWRPPALAAERPPAGSRGIRLDPARDDAARRPGRADPARQRQRMQPPADPARAYPWMRSPARPARQFQRVWQPPGRGRQLPWMRPRACLAWQVERTWRVLGSGAQQSPCGPGGTRRRPRGLRYPPWRPRSACATAAGRNPRTCHHPGPSRRPRLLARQRASPSPGSASTCARTPAGHHRPEHSPLGPHSAAPMPPCPATEPRRASWHSRPGPPGRTGPSCDAVAHPAGAATAAGDP